VAGHPSTLITDKFIPKSNTAANQNFTPVFLAYARLYTFARMMLIEPLKALVLHKPHSTLIGFRLYAERVRDVIELAKYVYNNDHTPDRGADRTIN